MKHRRQQSPKLDAAIQTAQRTRAFAPPSEVAFVADAERTLVELKGRFAEYEATAEAAFVLLERPTPDWDAARQRLDRLQQLEISIASTIRLLHGSLQQRILERVTQAQERERRTGVAIIALSVVAIVVGLLATGVAASPSILTICNCSSCNGLPAKLQLAAAGSAMKRAL